MASRKQISKHYSKVADLGCIICKKMGFADSPAAIHHIKDQFMLGKKADYLNVIPLCPLHHRISEHAYHYSPKNFSEKWGSQAELLEETNQLLNGR